MDLASRENIASLQFLLAALNTTNMFKEKKIGKI